MNNNVTEVTLGGKSKISTKTLVTLSLFSAIIFVLGLTPVGYIPIGIVQVVTVHIPVIIGSILLGPKYGAVLGFMFGLTSFITAHMNAGMPIAYFFSPFISGNILSLVICFLPRILVGIAPYYVFKLLKSFNQNVALITSGVIGSVINSVLVIGFMYLFFKEKSAEVLADTGRGLMVVLMANIGINALLEAVTAAILTAAIGSVMFKISKK